jgi:hypothetical protein
MKVRLAQVAVALFVVWVFLANLTPLASNDLWLQIRVGADLLRDRALPRVDVYSATAAGRPFLAHEWLSSVIFHVVASRLGIGALSVLQALVGAACAALLYFSASPEVRRAPLTLLLACAALYLVGVRLALRPHVFSLLCLCALVLIVERWRRSRRLLDLAWLVPLQLVWVNLHGEALVAPVVLGGLALAALLPEPDRTPRDALPLALAAGATLAATLCNPYGAGLIRFAFGMGAGNDYIKQSIFEWTPTLHHALGFNFVWVYLPWLALLWIPLLMRIRQRPFFDLALAVAATGFSLDAKRLVPYAAIFGFPVVARSFAGLRWRRQPLAECALCLALGAFALFHGFSYLHGEGLPVGVGASPALPLPEVERLRDQRGVVFDEYADGALIIYEGSPGLRPVMDSRIDVYGGELYDEHRRALDSPLRFSEYLDEHGVDLILLAAERRGAYQWLAHNPGWRLLFTTPRRFAFARAN